MLWSLIYRACEGGYLTPDEVMMLWDSEDKIIHYSENMLFSSTWCFTITLDKLDRSEKQVMDAYSIRILEIMEKALELLPEKSKKIWRWWYPTKEDKESGKERLELEYIGQYITSTEDSAKSSNPVTLWRVRAHRKLRYIATDIAENIVAVVKKGLYKKEVRSDLVSEKG
ncbi:MAG: hypothetical protein WC248_05120 [Candidatus Methanomethylophilaceae archaeon]|jgi:hypothetical protein